ncbi:MAG: type IV pilus twitching motility protein PilT [Dethiobacter sp.]|nr:type IV pilus twitching motility protein PilT [Dethiobacter sp.]
MSKLPTISELMAQVSEKKASDLHISVRVPPIIRLHGELIRLEYPPLMPDDTEAMAKQILSERQWALFTERGEIDFSIGIAGIGRYRVNVYRQRGSVGMALRAISGNIPSLEKLNMPSVLDSFTKRTKGLFLVTGPTGSGKSTTLAAMLDMVNRNRSCHILTLEDPIEYLHSHQKSIVNQREIGADSHSFANALRAALRQDPDVILVGEMRDLETIGIAITAAETGHLVMATLHTINAPQTIDRIIDIFPPHQQQQIKVQLSNSLIGVLSQQLLRLREKEGRIAATELMVVTPAVRNLIREGKTHQIYSAMQTGARFGMQTMDSSLRTLYREGKISYEDALNYAIDPESMLRELEVRH